MNMAQIEKNLQKLIKNFNKDKFIYDFLRAYGLPKASITRLEKGNLNLSKVESEISWKKKLFFREEQKEDLHITVTKIAKDLKHNERFIIVSDYKTILAIDTKTDEKLDINLKDLPKHYDFFLPWAGMEKAQHSSENPADVKAAVKMAKLFDEIKKDNTNDSPEFIHGLNVFLSRLLFCFFAEDTHIFEDSQFTNAISSHTQSDGSDLNSYLDTLFKVMNTPNKERKNLPEYLNAFPYVNGGLFEKEYKSPTFSRSSRSAILSSGEQNWSAINPDIFGSMFQAVIGAEQRGSLGQHYTSVPNIMKVIEPLFLNELYEEFESSKNKKKKLKELLTRIYNLKIFDPACGSGNFLIIAYKELRILEMKILKAGDMMALSGIKLSQFYGIEIDDFAGEIAKLALWLAEHQMNVEFHKKFGRTNETLPLKEAGKIVQGNATRLDWEVVCPKTKNSEVYILGNPPYLGSSMQSNSQKNDKDLVFKEFKSYKNLDYISIWFKKGADFIFDSNSQCAFVSTNSLNQGEQVALLWPYIFARDIEISFAFTSFKWTNSAKGQAGVTVVIIGLRNNSKKNKFIFQNGKKQLVNNINAYLTNADNIIINKRRVPISFLPEMVLGNAPKDGGNLLLDDKEKNELLLLGFPKEYIKKYIGSSEFIRGITRWCLWLDKNSYSNLKKNPIVINRIQAVEKMRNDSPKAATREFANVPYRFVEIRHKNTTSFIIPSVSSSRRKYLPCGFLDGNSIISNSAQAIYNGEVYVLGILLSLIHIVWVKAVAGYLKTDYRYSSVLCYNTFPFPEISTQRKNEITQAVFRILEEREKHSDKTLAQLYDPDKMPDGLREAHRHNDEIIEKCYRSRPFTSDEERLEYLFKLYEKMISEEKEKDTLFAKEKKKTKKRK